MLVNRIKKHLFDKRYNSNRSDYPSLSDEEIERINNLRTDVKSIDLDKIGSSTDEWVQNLYELKELLLTKDPRFFLHWGVIKRTMFFEPPLLEYKSVSDYYTKEYLREDSIGDPKPYYECIESSGNLIHHAYSLQQILKRLDLDGIDSIVEFGGGYGSMCRLIRRLGFTGNYHIFDLPLFSILQRYFLQSCSADFLLNTHFANEIDELECALDNIDRKKMLCIATWSISEAPIELRDAFLKAVGECNYLFAYQENFSGVNNLEYFHSVQGLYPEICWDNKPIKHLPGHYYLTGVLCD